MGKSEEPKVTKSDNKPSSPADQTNVHVYPDWAAMQAYYGPRVAMPPYYNSAMAASGHPPPYMWNPQHMMSPYGTPYAAVYPHGGGVYAHPGFPMGSQPQGQKGAPLTTPGTPLNIDTPSKSTGNTENGLMKKLKEFDGLAMSLGNGNPTENNADERKRSRSSSENEGSTDGSDGNTTGADEPKLKRSREGTPTKDEKKHLVQSSSFRSVSQSSGDNCVKPSVQGGGAIVSAAGVSANSNPIMSQSLAMVPPETWLQNERELKRERRKQSNRESARRSRLRKQAETEELARKVEALTAENMALRSELNQLSEKSDKLRGANATLLDKLKSSEPEKRVKNSGTGDNNKSKNQGDSESNSTSKLHQLLDTKPRADGVAAR